MEEKPQLNHDRINLAHAAPLSSPLVVYMETTTNCNLACKFCPHYLSPDEFSKGTMDYELFKKVCNDLKEFKPRIKLLRFCGLGDSLFNKQITKFVEYAVDNQVADRYEMITNGLLLDDKHFNILSKKLDRLIVSIEGLNNEDYFEFTNRKIKFDEFVNKLSQFSKLESRHCKLHIKIHNSAVNSEDKIKHFYNLFSGIADELYIENLINLWPNLVSNLGINAGHRFVDSATDTRKVCAQIFKSIQVNHDGKVMPCCIDWKVQNVIGDVQKQSLDEIWGGELIRDLQIKHLNGKRSEFSPCAGCTMNEESDIDNLDRSSEDILKRIRRKYESDIRI
ncbi:radical SAM protein [Polynucleobacter paneuropaeus]|nr:radical SAM protein [Polynucleobacter paneuropaeus]